MTGRVILVGAGPGDPDLLTRRGEAALRRADAVVYDALASEELLELAPRAEHHNVGKRGHDAPTRSQEDTIALLLRLAREGKTVVRLKGGDPLVFGRGGEEASACAEAGIPFEIVPGVSSVLGALAYAGIPITDRRHAASFAVVTGHKDPTRVSEETRWAELATSADTLVILMGMRNLAEIVPRLLAGGRSPETPSAVVMDGTLPSQRVVQAPLGSLVERVQEAGLRAPALVVIGDVVSLRESLAWVETRPLFGRRVLVTRAREQAGPLVAALRAVGAEPVRVPMIRFAPPSDTAPVDAALARLADYDALCFASANAARFFAERAARRGVRPGGLRATVLCVGPGTADALREAGLPVHGMPGHRRDAEGLLAEAVKRVPPAGRRFLVPRAEVGREVLPDGLRTAGAQVDAVPVYRTEAAPVDGDALREALRDGSLDVLTFTSPSTVKAFDALLDGPSRQAAAACTVAAIGPSTVEALRRAGLEPDVTPDRAGVAELVEALVAEVPSRR